MLIGTGAFVISAYRITFEILQTTRDKNFFNSTHQTGPKPQGSLFNDTSLRVAYIGI